MEKAASPWSVPVAVDDIPETGLHVEIEPTDAIRAELAKLAAVRALPRLSASFDLTRRGAGVHVAGRVRAQVGQICVVSLEPMESDVDEPVDLLFAPGAAGAAVAAGGEFEAGLASAAAEPPEPLVNGKVDLGAIATEFLILGIDPYPRKPDAEFSPPKADNDGAHPFAALEALKKRPGGGQS
jgi:uncharacterized metal-binding protein YceD (DUF177 family)